MYIREREKGYAAVGECTYVVAATAVGFGAVPPCLLTARNLLKHNFLIRVVFYKSVHLCNTCFVLPLFKNLVSIVF